MIGTTAAEITVHKRGTASLLIRSKYNPSAAVTANISVGILNERQYTVRLSQYRFTYDGTEHKPTVTLLKNGDEVAESDYTVSFKGDLVNAGTVNVIVEGKGNLEGTLTREFTIAAADFSKCEVTLSDKPIYFYENKAYTTEFTVKDGSKLLKEGKDFTVEYQYNDKPGNANVIFKGMGNYTSSQISKQFFIVPRDFYYCDITLSGESFTETGKEIKPEVTIKFGEKILQKDKDFIVLYVDNVKPGTATVTISGKGTYTGSVSKTFKIARAKATIKAASKTVTMNSSKKYSITEKIVTDGKVKVSWKTVKSISGYEIQYSTSSNMKNAKKITAKSNAVSTEISKMTSKKNYYIRIRSYKTVSGKKYYSEWSTVKKVKVK